MPPAPRRPAGRRRCAGAGDLPELESAGIAAVTTAFPTCAPSAARRLTRPRRPPSSIGYPVVVKIDNVAHKAQRRRRGAGPGRRRRRARGGRADGRPRDRGRAGARAASRCWSASPATRDYGATVVGRRRRRPGRGARPGHRTAWRRWTRDGARELVASLPALDRLLGGEVPDGLIEAIVAVSRLAAEHPEIAEIDVNPLLVSPERAVALDCLIVLERRGASRMSEAVLYETRGPAAWVTLNRPEKLNALNGAVLEGLHAAFDRAVADDEVKVVVVTGAGERAFSAGYDLSAEAAHSDIPAHEWHERAGHRHRRDHEAVGAAEADHRRRARLLPGRRLRAGDGLRHDHQRRERPVRRAGDPLRIGAGDAADAVHPRPEEDQRAAVHRRHDRRRGGRASRDDQPRRGRRTSWTRRWRRWCARSRRRRCRCCG